MCLDLTRQMVRQRTTGRLLRFLLRLYLERQVHGYFFFATRRLQLFELKLQLCDLPYELLAPGAEQHPLQLVEQQLEVGYLAGTRGKLFVLCPDQRLHRLRIEVIEIGQQSCWHRRSMPQSSPA